MKKAREYLYELKRKRVPNYIPYIEQFRENKELRNLLFLQYLQTETKPNFELYIDANSKSQPGTKESQQEVRHLQTEFYDQLRKAALPEKYFTHTIEKIPILITLEEIDQDIRNFQKSIFNKDILKTENYPRAFADKIKYELKKIGIPSVSKMVLKEFLDDNTHKEIEYFMAGSSKQDAKINYGQIKTLANSYLLEYLESFQISSSNSIKSNIKWNGTQTEFIELVKALIENDSIKGLQKDVISSLSGILNLEVKNPDKIIQDIKKRNTDSETLFLNNLKSSLYNFISKDKRENQTLGTRK